ncbi:MAG: hypothetical protein HQL31_10910 [Planctomycetes bacterium]|nr:hypothetical protein [Planctomycetota bacterium]
MKIHIHENKLDMGKAAAALIAEKTASKRAPSKKNAAKAEVHATPVVSKDEAK